eukprot:c45303_g1_i1 orf=66-305(+)
MVSCPSGVSQLSTDLDLNPLHLECVCMVVGEKPTRKEKRISNTYILSSCFWIYLSSNVHVKLVANGLLPKWCISAVNGS